MPQSCRANLLRRAVVGAAVTLALLPACAAPAADGPARPNVVVLLTDDQGWGDLSIHGNTNLHTPHIDSLAQGGALFERFFVCPVCSPTRAEFLTGRYHPRAGVSNVSTGGERIDLDERTIADLFRAAGYATAAFGKWHNGGQYPYHPLGRGFREFYGFCSGHWGDYFGPPLEHNGERVRGEGFITDDLADHAIRFITDHQQEPFFCYVPFNTPHAPFQAPDRAWQKFVGAELSLRAEPPAREDLQTTRAVLAMCENIDENVGRILEQLDKLHLADNTIVLYFCDNGPNTPRWNGGMRGRKGTTDEGGVRSPLLVRWPGKIPPGSKVTQIAGAIDLLPTLTALCGVPVMGGKPLDGMNLSPWLLGETSQPAERMIFSHWGGKVSVRTPQHRLDDQGRLYDMSTDPGQKHDLAGSQPEIAQKLRAAVDDWRRDVLAELKTPDARPFAVGHRQLPAAWLPAADGVPHGTLERSTKAPNCSYFRHWTSSEDNITWQVEVATPGRYVATVFYTCKPENTGCTMELNLLGQQTSAAVTAANDPPLHGLDHDRAPRGAESEMKDFKPLPLGELLLPAGRGELTLRALKIPGHEAIDVNAVELRLLD